MNNFVVRIIEETFDTEGHVVLKGDLGNNYLRLYDIIEPCFRRLGLNCSHNGLCILRIKNWWLDKNYRSYPGYSVFNVKIESLDADCVNDFVFEYNKPVKEKLPKPEKIIFHGPATIAIWPDGSKTVVKCQNGDDYDAEKAIALVYLKKMYGTNKSKSNYLDNLIKDVEIVDQKAKSIDTDSYTSDIDAGYQKALENAKKRLYSASDDILESLGILGR